MNQATKPLSIIVPTLNEADNLPLLFERLYATLSKAGIPFEILVIDDHSTDATLAVAQRADPKYHVRLLTKQGKRGKAFSLLEGFAAAKHDLVCMIDGDLQYPPEAIVAMYHKMQYCDADVIITERVDNQTSALRRLSSAVYNFFFIKLLFGIDYDTQSGLKLFKKKILRNITLSPSPWSFDLEFIVRSLEQGYTVLSHKIPFSERHAGVPKVHMLSATLELSSAALRLWRKASTKRVRLHYKNLQILQRSFMCFLAVSAAVIGINIHAPKASALDLQPVAAAVQAVTSLPEQLAKDVTNGHGPGRAPTNNRVVSVSPLAVSRMNSQPMTPPVAADGTPSAQPATTPTDSQPSSSKPVNKPLGVSTEPNATTLNVVGRAPDTGSLTSATGKQAKYYPASKLSNTKTGQFLRAARSIVIAGGMLVAVGVMIVAGKLLSERFRRQPIRT